MSTRFSSERLYSKSVKYSEGQLEISVSFFKMTMILVHYNVDTSTPFLLTLRYYVVNVCVCDVISIMTSPWYIVVVREVKVAW